MSKNHIRPIWLLELLDPVHRDLVQPLALWISRTYADIWENEFDSSCQFGIDEDCVNFADGNPWTATRSNGERMLELAPEFIAQSTQWPKGG